MQPYIFGRTTDSKEYHNKMKKALNVPLSPLYELQSKCNKETYNFILIFCFFHFQMN